MDKGRRADRSAHNQQIYDEAAGWLVNFRTDDIDAAAKQAFNQWLRKSPGHIEAYLEVSAFWADVPQAVSKDDIDIPALIEEARADTNIFALNSRREPPGPAKKRELTSTRRTWLIAASVLLAATSALAWWHVTAPTYATGIGEQRLITLADGSTVELNTRSKIRVHFTGETREIELHRGQALFRVEKDTQRPFIVDSGDTRVRAVGTQFDVYRKASGTVVTVVEGRVEVRPERSGAPVMLSAQEQIIVTATKLLQAEPANVSAATAWTQRQMVFQGTSLADVVEEVNRYNPRPLVITDPTLQTVRISGVFSLTRPASLVLFLREQVGLKVIEQGDQILISTQ